MNDERLFRDVAERQSKRKYDSSQTLKEKAVQLRKDGKLELAAKTENTAKRLKESGATYATMCTDLNTDEDFDYYLSGLEAGLNNMKRYGLSFEKDEKELEKANFLSSQQNFAYQKPN